MEALNKEQIKPNDAQFYAIFVLFGLLLALAIRLLSMLFSRKMKKFIDLHLHLDGAITVDIAKKLAAIQKIELPAKTDEELEECLSVQPDCTSLFDFLKRFNLPLSLLQTKEGLSEAVRFEAVRLVSDNIQSHGVVYAEIRFAPQLHKQKGMTQEEAVLAALDGLRKTTLKVNLILCFMRGDGNMAENDETLELARKYLVKDGGVVALDLAGAEAQFETSNYRDIFAKAKEYGIPFTIHSVRDAIEFGAKRIGHGTRAYQDPSVVELIKSRGIFLEMCPTSNKQTFAVEDMSTYPFMDYLHNDIKVTLNTDDMGIEGTTLPKEFEYMENKFGLTYSDEKIILRNSIDAAFTTDNVKQQLKQNLGL